MFHMDKAVSKARLTEMRNILPKHSEGRKNLKIWLKWSLLNAIQGTEGTDNPI